MDPIDIKEQAIPAIEVGQCAFFFDVDGTLAPIAATPHEASIPVTTLQILQRLVNACNGAVAIVSGRPLAEIDQLLAPLVVPAAGLHGAQWRDPGGATGRLDVDEEAVLHMTRQLGPMLARHEGLLLEQKGMAFALHYRHAPECEDLVRNEMEKLIQSQQGFVLQPGKMVVEIKPSGASKAIAIERFMQQSPFPGRTPVFAGDDLTDEAGFVTVNAQGGLSIKVGRGHTSASWRLPDPESLAEWLGGLA
jgi:trehalose 6-phosphate phosphatase